MCYHASTPKKTDVKKQFPKKQVFYESDKIYHVSGFTRPFLPVTLNNNKQSIIAARWKLIPFWVKNEADAAKYANTLNAEGESIFTKASYKPYIGKQRGLLYVDGFFEPHQVKGVKESQNYYIYKPNHKIFTLGIVYSIFADQDTGETYPTFSIITTKANSLLEEIHNVKKRMPLIIPENKREDWLSANTEPHIKELIKPYQGTLDTHQVYRVTGSRGENTNRPDIIKPID
ncbi:MAG TPA: SOS response-associated peptidase family protein [Chitinophagaceae bacterium]|nr:SOS response-associated peptidase family protein [Chitinophagaceae bacterium]